MTGALNRAPSRDSARGPGVCETPGPHPVTRRRPASSTSAPAPSATRPVQIPPLFEVHRQQEREAGFDVGPPARGASMNQLPEPRFGLGTEFPKVLSLEVELATGAADAREQRRAVLGQNAGGPRPARIADNRARLRDDLEALLVEVQRRRLARACPPASNNPRRRDGRAPARRRRPGISTRRPWARSAGPGGAGAPRRAVRPG